jgi:PleD family two-component response regulator
MTSVPFCAGGTRLLTRGEFELALDSELKRALRAQTFVTLLAVEPRRLWDGLSVTADDGAVSELAEAVGQEVRDTDLIGWEPRGTLWLMLPDTDAGGSRAVVERVVERIDSHGFSTPLSVAVGAASCPTHAVDAESLKREAVSRPMLSARPGTYHDSSMDHT